MWRLCAKDVREINTAHSDLTFSPSLADPMFMRWSMI